MQLSIHSKPPLFNVKTLNIPDEIDDQSFISKIFFGRKKIGDQILILHDNELKENRIRWKYILLNDLYLPEVVNVLSDIFLSDNFNNIAVLRWFYFGIK